MRQVGYLQRLYRDARLAERKIREVLKKMFESRGEKIYGGREKFTMKSYSGLLLF